MALSENVEIHDLADLTEFSDENRIRKKIFQSKGLVCELICYEPGQQTVIHQHPMQDEYFYVVEGSGKITFEDREDIAVKRGSVVFVPAGIHHGIGTSDTDRLVIITSSGPGVTGKAAKSFMLGE